MPRQNRVTPFGNLIASSARGTLTGNRGCLHDAAGQIRRDFQGQRWIICLLEFKGRRRPIMLPGRYTELFFLDEATALAAGHRPCAECQRQRFDLFRGTWAKANPEIAGVAWPGARLLDTCLHHERLAKGAINARTLNSVDGLPDGAFITDDQHQSYLVLRGQLLPWTPYGYERQPTQAASFPVRVLTPPSILRTLEAGYPAGIHPSAWQAISMGV